MSLNINLVLHHIKAVLKYCNYFTHMNVHLLGGIDVKSARLLCNFYNFNVFNKWKQVFIILQTYFHQLV